MDCLRRLQEETLFPLSVRQAAERLSTSVAQRQAAPFTVDPLSDANIVIAHLAAATNDTSRTCGLT